MTVFYPPHIEFSGQPEISISAPTGSEPSAVIHWAGGNEHLTGVAQADERIGIYLQAKEMLAGYRHAVANHAGIGEYASPFTAASATEAAQCAGPGDDGVICTRLAGHDGLHYTVTSQGAVQWPESGLPVAEDDGGDGDDNREPYCTVCLFTLDAAGEHHLYPDDAIVAAHETVLGWREPVGVPSGEDAQSAEVRRIGKLHTDGHITAAECAELVDKALGEHA